MSLDIKIKKAKENYLNAKMELELLLSEQAKESIKPFEVSEMVKAPIKVGRYSTEKICQISLRLDKTDEGYLRSVPRLSILSREGEFGIATYPLPEDLKSIKKCSDKEVQKFLKGE